MLSGIARAGVTPLDEEVLKRVRESGVPCAIVANKCDIAEDDVRADEFLRFGMPVMTCSAEHGRGVAAIVEFAESIVLPPPTASTKSIFSLRHNSIPS